MSFIRESVCDINPQKMTKHESSTIASKNVNALTKSDKEASQNTSMFSSSTTLKKSQQFLNVEVSESSGTVTTSTIAAFSKIFTVIIFLLVAFSVVIFLVVKYVFRTLNLRTITNNIKIYKFAHPE